MRTPARATHPLLATGEGAGRRVERAAQLGEELQHPLDPGGGAIRVVAVDERGDLQVLPHREVVEDAVATGQQLDAQSGPLLGRHERDRSAVEAHDAVGRSAQPGDDPQDRRLPGAVGPEQGEHLARLHLEADVEEDLDLAVGEVDVAHLQRRHRVRVGESLLTLLFLLADLGDDQRQVVLDEHRAAHDQQARR